MPLHITEKHFKALPSYSFIVVFKEKINLDLQYIKYTKSSCIPSAQRYPIYILKVCINWTIYYRYIWLAKKNSIGNKFVLMKFPFRKANILK